MQNFRGIYQTLFGGGTGEMRLTDPDNLADSGIDIVCSPPGKRLQNVLLLSGGEKALGGGGAADGDLQVRSRARSA